MQSPNGLQRLPRMSSDLHLKSHIQIPFTPLLSVAQPPFLRLRDPVVLSPSTKKMKTAMPPPQTKTKKLYNYSLKLLK